MFKWLKAKSLQMLSGVVKHSLQSPDVLRFLGMPYRSTAGQDVTPDRALLVGAVYQAVTLYGDCMGIMPFGVYRAGGSRRKYAADHPTHKVLHSRPNKDMTAMTFWALMEAYRLLGGRAVAEIEWNGRGQCIGLQPIHPDRVMPQRNQETRELEFLIDGQRTLKDKDVFHVPNFSWCGTHGLSTLEFARETLGRTLAAGELASTTFDSGGVPPGFFRHPGRMDKAARDNFRKEQREENVKNKGAIGILWEDMEYQATGLSMEDLQFLDTLKAGTLDVARYFRVPPHMLMEYERAINNNAEAGDLGWVKYSLLPVCARYEQEANEKLLTADHYTKHSVEGLLRGDHESRANWFQKMREIGVYSINDILELEDMDGIGPDGDIRVCNAAYIPIQILLEYWEKKSEPGQPAVGVPNDPKADPATANNSEKPNSSRRNGQKQPPRLTHSVPEESAEPAEVGDILSGPQEFQPKRLEDEAFFRSEWGRMLRREDKGLLRAAKRAAAGQENFLDWMDKFYENHQSVMEEVLAVPASRSAIGAVAGSGLVPLMVRDHISRTKEELRGLADRPRLEFAGAVADFIAERQADLGLSRIATSV